jgi:CHAD domain-containing protein
MAGNKAAICRFGAERLQVRLRAFEKEIEGVREGRNPEYVHRMRVASRRLRSTLPLFSCCFPGRRFRRWMKDLRAITRGLGRARDTDVQILFLDQYERDLPPESGDRPAVSHLRAQLMELRRTEQDTILSALDAIEGRETIREISDAVRDIASGTRHGGAGAGRGYEVYRMAALRITEALDALLAFEKVLADPDDVTGHHAMRIAAKRLRYTIEVFRPLYGDRIRPVIRSLKRLLEILGELHDCDVWILLLSHEPERPQVSSGTSSEKAAGSASSSMDAGTPALLNNRRERRDELFRRLVTAWTVCGSASVWEHLRDITGTLHEAEHAAGLQEVHPDERQSERKKLGGLGGLFPEGLGHALQVTRLSLLLFDELSALHGYGKKERRLLRYAGRLHDIGWAFGQKGHHTRSCHMILADRSLPVTGRERAIIALVARYHRKSFPDETDRVFAGMKPKDRKRVLALSSLIRIADGLDYTHSDRVGSLTCTAGPGAVTCIPVFEGDGAIERARALQKSDLFEQVFAKKFEIP